MKTILTLLCVMTTLLAADALQCYECAYVGGSSDNEPMTLVLKTMSAYSEKACKDGGGERKVECGEQEPLPEGHQWACAKGDIGTTVSDGKVEGLEAELRMVNRGCADVNTTIENYSIGCHPASAFRDTLEEEIIGADANIKGVSDFKGETCFCDTDNCNSAPGHIAFALLVFTMSLVAVFLK